MANYSIPSDRTITIKTMNTKSIDRAIKEIKGRRYLTQKRIALICERLAERGEIIAKALCDHYTHGEGDLKKSITAESFYEDGKFKTQIRMDAPYAAYVEFGTGIMGANDPHPNAGRRGWDYDVHNHGYEGWFYPYEPGKKHKFQFNPLTGKLQPWSNGEEAKPIMYYTLQQLKEEFPAIVREVFDET